MNEQSLISPGDTRAQIIAKALNLFADHGYAGVSVRDIVESVGITPGAIYHHFTGKQALYDIVVRHAFEIVSAHLVEEASSNEADPRKRLHEALDHFAHYNFARSPELRLIDRVLFETGEQGLDTAGVVNGPRQVLAGIIRQIDADAPADDLAEHAIAAIYGAAKLRPVRAAFREGDRFADPADLAESLTHLLLRSLDGN